MNSETPAPIETKNDAFDASFDIVARQDAQNEERWTISYGDAATPAVRWETGVAMLGLSSAQAESLLATDAPRQFHIRQSGRASLSRPLTIFLPD
jgi:hypothetical protein